MSLSQVDTCWAAVVVFYSCLHLVDRLASRLNIHPQSHGDRQRFLTKHHRSILVAYNDLKDASEIARYGTMNQFQTMYPATTVQTILIDQHLVAIETYVLAIFQPPPAPPPASP